MANRSKKTKNPHFFKFMLGNFSERMMIPPAFRENVKDVASGHAIIKGPSGNIWHVELAKDDHGICFQNGWQGFVRDHSLQMGDVLVFRYDGDLQFTVRVFDSSACEKEDAFCVKVCGTEVKKEKIELRNPPSNLLEVSHYGAQKTTTKRKRGMGKQVPQQRRSCMRSASSRKIEEPSAKPKLDETVDSLKENNPPAVSQEKIKYISHYGAQKTTTKRKHGLYKQVPQQRRSCTRSASSRKTEEPSDKPKLDETVDSFMESNPPAASQEKIKNIKTQPGNSPFSQKRLLIDEEKEMESVAANSKNHKCVTSAKVSVEENPAKLSEVSHYGAQKTTTKRKRGLYKQVPQQQRSCTRSASSRKTEEPSDKPKLDETVDSFVENNPPAASQEKIKYIKTQPGNPPFSQKRLLIDEEKEMESVAANSKNHKCVTSAEVSVEENPAKLSEVSHYGAQKATSKRKRGLHKQISQQQRPCTRSAFSRRKTEGTSGQAERKLDETADSFKENNPPTVGQAKQKHVKTHLGNPPFSRKRLLIDEEKEMEFEASNSKNHKSVMYYSKANKRKFDKFCSGYRPLTQRRVVTEEEKKRTLKEANSFESDNPFAVIVMRQSYVYTGTCMSFPAEFTRDHLPKANQKMVLEDTEGGAWSVQYLYYQSGSSLSAGWRALVFDKTIEEDDVCVFELIKEAVFRVHVFRVVKEITRMIKNGKKSNPRAGFGRVKVDS